MWYQTSIFALFDAIPTNNQNSDDARLCICLFSTADMHLYAPVMCVVAVHFAIRYYSRHYLSKVTQISTTWVVPSNWSVVYFHKNFHVCFVASRDVCCIEISFLFNNICCVRSIFSFAFCTKCINNTKAFQKNGYTHKYIRKIMEQQEEKNQRQADF